METERRMFMELSDKYRYGPKCRHEMKYQISRSDYLSIGSRIKPLMKTDVHSDENGRYTIYSVYFDNIYDKALLEKVNGVQKREKFRIRYYNNDFSFISLEKKAKYNDLCIKESTQISKDEFHSILSGGGDWMKRHPSALVKELYCKMKIQQLYPRVLVSYVREAYTYAPGNVRVTFDSDIRTSLFVRDFANNGFGGVGATDKADDMILEVKFDDFFPDVIARLVQTGNVRQQAFSKYCACRRFG